MCETIIKDVNEIANLDRLPPNIILKARASVWLALSYELFSIYEPEHINVPMLTRLVRTNMQRFMCPCDPTCQYETETYCLMHARQKHPHYHRAMIVVRRTYDVEDYNQLEMPVNRFINYERLRLIKQRLSKLSALRKRLPVCIEEKQKRQQYRQYKNDLAN